MCAKKSEKNIACCGLDCHACDAYLSTIRNDAALREKTAKLWSELNHVTILPEDIRCEGCRADGVKTVFCEQLCEIRQCVLAKDTDTCGNCDTLDTCPKVSKILSTNAVARKNLKRIILLFLLF